MNDHQPGSSLAVSALAVTLFCLALLTLGIRTILDEIEIDGNLALIGALVLTGLAFVGLSAVIWQLIRKMLD